MRRSTPTAAAGSLPIICTRIQPFINAANGQIVSARILNEIFHGGGSSSFYYATQQPDPQGNVTTVFNFSDSSNFVGLAYASRRAAQPVGTEPIAASLQFREQDIMVKAGGAITPPSRRPGSRQAPCRQCGSQGCLPESITFGALELAGTATPPLLSRSS